MKKIITLLSLFALASLSFSQVVFQSDLSSWNTAGDPTDWMGSSTSINSTSVTEVTTGAQYGTSFANLVNSSTSHKRFSTQPFTVSPNTVYTIKMYIAGTAGDVRVGGYNVTNSSYFSSNYSSYQAVSGGTLTVFTDSVTTPVGCTSMQYIISIRNTSTLGIGLDSVSVTGGGALPPPPKKIYSKKTIYEIQYTTSTSGDSPYKDSLVETTGIVTGTKNGAYFIQDTASAWNGVYVYDFSNSPSIGDEITVKGEVTEYFDLTEMKNIDTLITISSGNTLPTPISATSANVQDEQYEGVLMNLGIVKCVDTADSRGEWKVVTNGTTDTVVVNDLMFKYSPVLGNLYDLKGIMNYSFGKFLVEPRDSNDVKAQFASINELNNLSFSVYPNPVSETVSIQSKEVVNSIEIYSTEGKLVKSISSKSIQTINVSSLKNGVYILKVKSTDKVGTLRIVKK